MRRLLTLAAASLLAGCTLAGPEARGGPPIGRDPTAPALNDEPEVRVGVAVGVPTLELGGTDVELVDPSGRVRARGDGPWTVGADGDRLRITGGGESLGVPVPLVVRPAGDGPVRVGDRTYHGAVLVRGAEGGLTAVNLIDLETYLRGVVPLEIGGGRPAEELEAVKAQAIAARTYAIRHLGRRDALGFDFYATVQDQVYGGAGAEDPVASRAVQETRGEVIVHEGEPIEAFYHSTCGGRTAALHEVWPGDPRPYLRSVSDQRPDGGWFCESSNRFRWTEEWSGDELRAALTDALNQRGTPGTVSEIRSLEVTERTTSGRAGRLRVVTNLGTESVRGDSIRWVLRPEPGRILNSSAIHLDVRDGEALRVEGAGWGHGIGMCQIGALGRARAGHSYRDILGTYYPGTTIARLYR